MNFADFVRKYKNKEIDVDNVYGHQCTDLLKQYTIDVLGFKLWTFWGSAKAGWYNKSNTFPVDKWEKITNDLNDPLQVPKAEDLIFWWYGSYWHCAIWMKAVVGATDFIVFNQNTWSWNGYWYDDRSRIENQDYFWILWWYRYKKPNIKTCETKLFEAEQIISKQKMEISVLKGAVMILESNIKAAILNLTNK